MTPALTTATVALRNFHGCRGGASWPSSFCRRVARSYSPHRPAGLARSSPDKLCLQLRPQFLRQSWRMTNASVCTRDAHSRQSNTLPSWKGTFIVGDAWMKADTVACLPSSHSRRMAAIRKLRSTFPRTSFDDAKPHPRARSIPATLPERRTSHALRCCILQRQKTSTIRTRGMTADKTDS